MNQFRFAELWAFGFIFTLVITVTAQPSWSQVGWSEEKQLVQEGSIENRVTTPSIAVNGENVYIVYRQKNIKIIRSSDLGKTWSDPVTINPNQPINNYPTIAVFGSNLVVVWSSFVRVDSGLNSLQLFYAESGNRGISWSEPKRLNNTRDLALKPMFLHTGDTAVLTWLETPLQETLGGISTSANQTLTPETINQILESGISGSSLGAQMSQVRTKFYVSTYTARSGEFSSPVVQPDENFGSTLPRVFSLFGPVNNKLYIALNTNTEIKLYESTDQGQNWKRSFDESSFFDSRYLIDMKIIDGNREGVMTGAGITASQREPVEFFSENSLTNKIQLSPPHYVRSVPKFEMKDGIYHAVWEAGNQELSYITYMRTDEIPPTSSMVQPSDPSVKESKITFGWQGDDNISYTERLMYSYSVTENQWSQPQAETTVTIDAPADGEYIFRVRAEDVAGNIQNPVTEFTYNTFQSAPNGDWTNPPSPGQVLTSRSVTIPFTAQDNSDSPEQITYSVKVNDEPWSEFQNGSEHTFTNLPNGNHVLSIRTKDSRGNIDPTPSQCRVSVSVGLELVLNEMPILNSNVETSSFTWTAKDDTGNNVELQCYYILNGQAAQQTTTSTSLDLTGLEEGRYTIKIWGVDPSGDKTGEAEHQWVIDRTPPETTASFKREYSNGKAFIDLNATDQNLPDGTETLSPSKYEYNINDEGWNEFDHIGGNWLTSRSLPFYAWGYIVNIRAIDRAGNVDSTPVSIDLRIHSRTNPYIFYSVIGVLVIILLFLLKMIIPTGGGAPRKSAATASTTSAFDSEMGDSSTDGDTTKKTSFSMDDDDDPYA